MDKAQTQPAAGADNTSTIKADGFDTTDIDKAYNDMTQAVKAGDDEGLTEAITNLDKLTDKLLGEPDDDEQPDGKTPDGKAPAQAPKPDPFAAKLAKYTK